jgi:hypothetical protein
MRKINSTVISADALSSDGIFALKVRDALWAIDKQQSN